MIKVENVAYRIGGKPILTDVSVTVPQGGLTALIGPNGAGKSTLLSLIARLEPLQRGAIHVDDLQVGKCSDRDVAQRLSILPQMADQPPRLTVRELVSFVRYPYHRGRPGPADHAQVDCALAVLGITTLADRPLDSLSGGQRQRAQIAMIFAQDTDYVLLDEPLNNLDLAGSRTLMAVLRDFAKTHGKTVALVVHDINIAARYADQIIAMEDGCIARTGPPHNVIDTALIRDVFGTDALLVQVGADRIALV